MTEILKVFRQPENEVLMKSKRVSASETKLKRSFSETKTLFNKVKKSFCEPQGEGKTSFCEPQGEAKTKFVKFLRGLFNIGFG